MKKILSIFLFIVLSVALISLVGCTQGQLEPNLFEHISDMRECVFEARSDVGYFNYVCGKRESPYENDGKTGVMVDFGLISFYPATNVGEHFDVVLVVDDKQTVVTLEKNPFDDCLMADCKIRVDQTQSIGLQIDGQMQQMSCKSCEFKITANNAFEIAKSHLEDQINNLSDGENFAGEIYVMLLCDKVNNFENYFWYVAIFDGKTFESVLISTSTGEILAQKS